MAVIKIEAKKDTRCTQTICLIQGDRRTQILRFSVNRYDGGVDLSDLVWCIKAINAKGIEDVFEPTAVEIGESRITIDWLVDGTVTAESGMAKYELNGLDTTEGGNAIAWKGGTGTMSLRANIGENFGEIDMSNIDRLVLYVEGRLQYVIDLTEELQGAGEAAHTAAVAANAGAQRAEAAATAANAGAASATKEAANANAAAEAANAAALPHAQLYGMRVRGEVAKVSGNPVTCLADAGSLLRPVTMFEPKQEGEGDPSPENIRPISGWDSVELRHAGKNIIPWPYADGAGRVHNGITFGVNDDGSVTANGTVEGNGAIFRLGTGLKISNVSITSGAGGSATDGVFVLSDMARYNPNNDTMSINLTTAGKTYENVTYYPQAELGTVPTEYTPTAGLDVYTATLGETVYGGRYDWLTGKLVIEWYGEELLADKVLSYETGKDYMKYQLERIVYGEYNAVKPNSIVCSHYLSGPQVKVVVGGGVNNTLRIYSSGITSLEDWRAYLAAQKAAGTPVQVVYRLAEPIEIQLAPAIITAVEPEQNNTLYGDGNIEVEYVKPLHVSIEEHVAAAVAAAMQTE